MINGPRNWNELLKVAPKGSVLMGGAVRDFLLSKEAKDYDIFYPYQPGVPEIPGWEYIPRIIPDGEAHPDYDIVQNGQPNPIASVYDYKVEIPYTGIPGLLHIINVQLVGVHYQDPVEHFKNFDHTLTLGFYSDKGMVADRRLFDSVVNKTVTCTNTAKPIKSLFRAKSVVARIDPEAKELWTYQGFF